MRKADLVTAISEKIGVPKVDVLVTLETFFKEVKGSLAEGENVYIRGFGSFIIKKSKEEINEPKESLHEKMIRAAKLRTGKDITRKEVVSFGYE